MCLESRKTRQALRDLKDRDPEFYKELTNGKSQPNLIQNGVVAEDEEIGAEIEDIDADDSNVSVNQVINGIVDEQLPDGFTVQTSGVWMPTSIAECSDEAEIVEKDGLTVKNLKETNEGMGRGKRKRESNRLYSSHAFWRHNDSEGSDVGEA
jgi:hypothetical protein